MKSWLPQEDKKWQDLLNQILIRVMLKVGRTEEDIFWEGVLLSIEQEVYAGVVWMDMESSWVRPWQNQVN